MYILKKRGRLFYQKKQLTFCDGTTRTQNTSISIQYQNLCLLGHHTLYIILRYWKTLKRIYQYIFQLSANCLSTLIFLYNDYFRNYESLLTKLGSSHFKVSCYVCIHHNIAIYVYFSMVMPTFLNCVDKYRTLLYYTNRINYS